MSFWKETLGIRFFGLLKIPLIFFVKPSVIELNDQRCEIKIPLRRRTKNHVNSMYFGALAIGVDLAGGLLAMKFIRESKKNVVLIFKDFKADFLKMAKADVHFVCENGKEIKKLVAEAIQTKERVNYTMKIVAITPKISGDEPVAKFELTLSLKAR